MVGELWKTEAGSRQRRWISRVTGNEKKDILTLKNSILHENDQSRLELSIYVPNIQTSKIYRHINELLTDTFL